MQRNEAAPDAPHGNGNWMMGAIPVSLRILKRRMISVLGCAFTCASSLFMLFQLTGAVVGIYAPEARACAGAIAVLSLASLLTDSIGVFCAFHFIRAIATVVILYILRGEYAILELLLLLPVILETALYVKPLPSVLVSAIFIGCCLAIDVQTLHLDDPAAVLSRCTPVLLASCAFAATGAIITWYREMSVVKTARLREYDLALVSLESANREYLDYADKMESISEDKERRRITREIHDTIGYSLTNIGMLAQAAKAVSAVDPAQLNALLDEIRNQSNTLLSDSRNILYRLRSITQPKTEFMPVIYHLARSLRNATGMEVEIAPGNAPNTFSETIDKAIIRLVQEGITNAIRHGRAKRIRITFWLSDSDLQIRVWDNGLGSDNVTEGIGLKGMKERFALFGGWIEARTVMDGFLLSAYIPTRELSHGEE